MPKSARYYSPEMGRFISEDPIGLLGGVNYFAYVGNSPCNFTDPLGLQSADDWSRALTGMRYDDFISDAVEREASRVEWINGQNRKKAERALKNAEAYGKKVERGEKLDELLTSIPPSEGGLALFVIAAGVKLNLATDRSWEKWYWSEYDFYKNRPLEQPNFYFNYMVPNYIFSDSCLK